MHETFYMNIKEKERLFQASRPKDNKHLSLIGDFFATPLILPDKSTPACTQKCITWFIQAPWKTEIAFFPLPVCQHSHYMLKGFF